MEHRPRKPTNEFLEENEDRIKSYMARHVCGDWMTAAKYLWENLTERQRVGYYIIARERYETIQQFDIAAPAVPTDSLVVTAATANNKERRFHHNGGGCADVDNNSGKNSAPKKKVGRPRKNPPKIQQQSRRADDDDDGNEDEDDYGKKNNTNSASTRKVRHSRKNPPKTEQGSCIDSFSSQDTDYEGEIAKKKPHEIFSPPNKKPKRVASAKFVLCRLRWNNYQASMIGKGMTKVESRRRFKMLTEDQKDAYLTKPATTTTTTTTPTRVDNATATHSVLLTPDHGQLWQDAVDDETGYNVDDNNDDYNAFCEKKTAAI